MQNQISISKQERPLEGKKVLMFAPVFFDYQKKIKKTIEDLGAVVHFYDERNNPTTIDKILIRVSRKLMSCRTNKFYKKVSITEAKFKPDYVLFINPEAITKKSMVLLRTIFKDSQFILYMWDSLENKKTSDILYLFDRKFSFDQKDCLTYNLNLLPLFYCSDFEQTEEKQEYEFDLSFIGTVHSDRAKILYQIKEICENKKMTYCYYLFIPSRLVYLIRYVTDKYLRKLGKEVIHLKPLTKEEASRICIKTRCIIDINHPQQTGLTIRTIEMLGLGKKIATTNLNVKNYDFYKDKNNIILDRKNIQLNKDYIVGDYERLPRDIYLKYSIRHWALVLFGF